MEERIEFYFSCIKIFSLCGGVTLILFKQTAPNDDRDTYGEYEKTRNVDLTILTYTNAWMIVEASKHVVLSLMH